MIGIGRASLVAVSALATLATASPAAASLISPASPRDLATALAAQPGLVTKYDFTALSSPNAVGVGHEVGRFFPTDGPVFAALTTGDVAQADPPPSKLASTQWQFNEFGPQDVTQLLLVLQVPAGTQCLSLDYAFYSEEWSRKQAQNDGFLAQLDDNRFGVQGPFIVAKSNFALVGDSQPASVYSIAPQSDTRTAYEGSSALLRAATPISPGVHRLYLTVFDVGDGLFDSAAFVDDLRTSTAPCTAGSAPVDSDGDGLPDDWETKGVDVNGDGTIDLDLPALGTRPNHKDVFVEVDAMRGHKLDQQAIDRVVAAFAAAPVTNPDGATGIALHVDNGPGSAMMPGVKWGGRSGAEILPPSSLQGVTGSCPAGVEPPCYDWTAFDAIKKAHFSHARLPVFHYALSGDTYDADGHSGLSRSVSSSDFMVTLGAFCPPAVVCSGSVSEQAATFMHELGHNLGLDHGGADDFGLKPNYLSVMNYAFSLTGIPSAEGENVFDYSMFGSDALATLDETALDEAAGLPALSPAANGRRSFRLCAPGGPPIPLAVGAPVDWNCDGTIGGLVKADVNGDGSATDHLVPFNDWVNLVYRGGAIGGFDRAGNLPSTKTVENHPPTKRLLELARAVARDGRPPLVVIKSKRFIGRSHKVRVTLDVRDNVALDSIEYALDGATVPSHRGLASKRVTVKKLPLFKKTMKVWAYDRATNRSKVQNIAPPKRGKKRGHR